jgi:dihydrofolate reductase
MPIALIAAVAENNCIGTTGQLPWYLPEDLKHFKALTTGNTVLMGRKTWESIPETFRPLPNRHNIVITRQHDYPVPKGVDVCASPEEALTKFGGETIFVIGGAEIYVHMLNRADTLHITHVHRTVDGDTFFPVIDAAQWKEVRREDHDEYSFVDYIRVR